MRAFILLGLVLLSLITHAQEKNRSVLVADQKLLKLETLVEALLAKTNLPGMSIAVAKEGQMVYAKGFGYADVESKQAMTSSTQLRTASVAKLITATALGRLASEGKLAFDAPIKTYVPYIHSQYAALTTRQLAGHTSGLTHRPRGNGYKNKQYATIRETVELIKAPLLFKPDTDYAYSTNGFNLLAAVIEGASGKSYMSYLQEEIFKSLGMKQTFAENIDELTKQDAHLYFFRKDKLRREKRLTRGSYKLAGAGFRSTPSDLVNMTQAYFNGFIDTAVVADMFKSHQLKNGTKTQVGIVWRSTVDAFGNKLIEHAGSWRGARTVVVYDPKEQLSIAIMVNATYPLFIEETAHILLQLFRNSPPTAPSIDQFRGNVEIVFNANGKEELLNGELILDTGKGRLSANSEGFLKSNELSYLGYDHHYVAITEFGLAYVWLEATNDISGKLYLYQSMNASNPVEGKPMVSFRGVH